jgi:hypothetical protein
MTHILIVGLSDVSPQQASLVRISSGFSLHDNYYGKELARIILLLLFYSPVSLNVVLTCSLYSLSAML